MVRSTIVFVSCLLLGCLYPSGNTGDNWYYDYTNITPVTITRDSLKRSVYSMPPAELRNPGKIYIRGNHLYINERYKGVHVINNTDPLNPQNVAFINIPGNIDITMRSTILYADNATDIVAINVANPTSAVVTSRIEKVFPRLSYPTDRYYDRSFPHDSLVIVHWKDTVYN